MALAMTDISAWNPMNDLEKTWIFSHNWSDKHKQFKSSVSSAIDTGACLLDGETSYLDDVTTVECWDPEPLGIIMRILNDHTELESGTPQVGTGYLYRHKR